MWMVASIILYVIYGIWTVFENDMYIVLLIGNIVIVIAWYGIAMISTFWVLYKVGLHHFKVSNMSSKRQLEILQASAKDKPSHSLPNSISLMAMGTKKAPSDSVPTDNNSIPNEKGGSFLEDVQFLTTILSNYHGYSAFISHLSNEFATECLLSVTEFYQYKQYLLRTFPSFAEKIKQDLEKSIGNGILSVDDIPVL